MKKLISGCITNKKLSKTLNIYIYINIYRQIYIQTHLNTWRLLMNLNLLDGIEDINSFLSTLSLDDKLEVLNYIESCEQYRKYHSIEFFEPDSWQEKAIAKGVKENVRGCLAGNR